MQIFFLLLFTMLASFAITGLIRVFLLSKTILDIPNERSSHVKPTPRGGGVGIALTFFLGVTWFVGIGIVSLPLAKALIGGGLLIAVTGYWDDLKSLTASVRAVLHFSAAIWVLYCLGGFPELELGVWKIHLGWFGSVFAAVGMVWLINLYNFMDGIDGLAGSEAIFVSMVGGVTLYFMGAYDLAAICFLLLAAVAGFLIWNWPPAKIFLGDVGSGLLGFVFAVLIVASANHHNMPIISWLTLLAVFIFDATFTLLYRMLRGEKWYCAHREHIYQRLVQSGMSHQVVTLWISLINFGILLPLFYLMFNWQKLSLLIFLFIAVGFGITWYKIVFAKK